MRSDSKTLLFILIPVAAALIAAACALIIIINSPAAAPDVTEPVSAEPMTYTKFYDGYCIKLLAADNESVPFDINAFFDESGTAWLFLPAEADGDKLKIRIYDEDSNETGSVSVKRSPGSMSKIEFENTSLSLGIMQTDLPSLCVDLDSGGPSLYDIVSDKQKSLIGYGNSTLFVPSGIAEKYGCETVFSSPEKDEDQPGSVTLKGRGHSSWMYLDKKNFSLKFEKSVSLLGMSKAKSWALVSNHFDRSLIRNMIVNDVASALGFYTEYRCVELFVNGDYCGSYQLTAKIKIGAKRVNITDLEEKNEALAGDDYPPVSSVTVDLPCGATVKYWEGLESPDDVTGGYLLEVDIASRAKKETSYVKTSRDKYFIVASPEYLSREEAFYLGEFLQGMEDAIYGQNGVNHLGKHFTSYVDVKTLAERYLIDEMCRNPDGGETSTFFYKDSDKKDGRLYSGPLWDYDLSMGNYSGFSAAEGFEGKNRFYYPELFRHAEFTNEIKANYNKIKSLLEQIINGKADEFKEYIRQSADMNFKRWDCMGKEIRVAPKKAAESFDQACSYIKNFLKTRLKWLDANLYKELK